MSTITIYRSCRVLEDKNMQVDNIANYLADFANTEKHTFNDAQYIRTNNLDLEVKVVLDQDYTELLLDNYNYARITNNSGVFYYFIRKIEQVAQSVAKLHLHLDVLNTYKDKYTLTNKTTIKRQHKDRFEKKTWPAHTQIITTWLDDTVWNWSTGAGEIIGEATFDLDPEFADREQAEYTFADLTIVAPGADYYEYNVDTEGLKLHITAYCQGEETPVPTGQVSFSASVAVKYTNIYRKIDNQAEGLDVVLFKQGEQVLQEYGEGSGESLFANETDKTYNLIYKATESYDYEKADKFLYGNAVDVFIAGNEDTEWLTAGGLTIAGNDLNWSTRGSLICWPTGATGKQLNNSFELIEETDKAQTVSCTLFYDNKYVDTIYIKTWRAGPNTTRMKQYCLVLFKHNNKYFLRRQELKRDNFIGDGFKIYGGYDDPSKIMLLFSTPKIKIFHTLRDNPIAGSWTESFWRRWKEQEDTDARETKQGSDFTKSTINSLNKWDRTDPQLVKILNMPYNIFDRKKWQPKLLAQTNTLKYDFSNKVYPEVIDRDLYLAADWLGTKDLGIYSALKVNTTDFTGLTGNESRDDYFESKLLHSDFAHSSFTYDNFKYDFNAELVDLNFIQNMPTEFGYVDPTNYINCQYIVSNTVASNFMFDFKEYWPLKESLQSYDSILVVNRNNEMPIYNNYYLNYLRTGYNFDVKNKQQQDTAAIVGGTLGTAASIASLVAGIVGLAAAPATGGATAGLGATGIAKGVVGLAAGTAGLATSLTGAITSSSKADRSLQQKLEQAKNQGASVKGADDIGLLTYYTGGNKAKVEHWGMQENTRERVADLFYYCGYKCEYQDTPNTTSRYWFNFIQAEPVFDISTTKVFINKECMTELINKYNTGITVYHRHQIGGNNYWDFNQEKNNIETWLITE